MEYRDLDSIKEAPGSCPSCGKMLDKAPLHLVVGEFRYLRCPSCSQISLGTQLSLEKLAATYPSDYYAHQIKKPSLGDRLRGLAMQDLGGYPRKPRTLWMRCLAYFSTFIYDGQIKVILPAANTLGYQPRLLDIGCGSGNFLAWARENGWIDHGVDNNPQAIANAQSRGLNVVLGDLSEVKYEDNYFDAIVFDNSLEHLPNPIEALRECRRILRPDGLLIVSVPNNECDSSKAFGPYWHYHSFCSTPCDVVRPIDS